MHAALRVALRHLLVHDAAARGHPLDVAGAEAAAISQTVAVRNASGKHVRDRFDAAVRMPWKPGEKILGVLVAEVVKEQKWIEFRRIAEPERPLELDASAFDGGLGLADGLYRAD